MSALKITALILSAIVCCASFPSRAESTEKVLLTDDWAIQSADHVSKPGGVISTPAFQPEKWHPATVPSTIVGTLVDDKIYPDPFFGMNLKALSTNNAFRGPWWYRKEFKLRHPDDGQIWLHFDGINYLADIWVNGKRIADTNQVVGAYRTYQFDITDVVAPGKPTVIAVEIFPPGTNSLGINWVDWNPTPPDKSMGLWRDVYITTAGPVSLHSPHVITKLDQSSLDKANVTISVDVQNTRFRYVDATLKGTLGPLHFSKDLVMAPYEIKHIEIPEMILDKPRLWWPVHMGPQNLYDLDLWLTVNGVTSDEDRMRIGIREATSELNAKGARVFKINGQPILVRGGGWTPDIFLRPSAEREIEELRYVKDMNLNAIRFEGKMESDRFLELCDREGILVIAGWCCCDFWEQWSQWKDNDYVIATESLRDQIRRLRNHPSLLSFWYGSDNPPNARAESNYLAVLKEMDWPNPAQSSASAHKPALSEPTGMKMSGPYEYVPPMYWYTDKQAGGAFSFNTETSPGPAIPPLDSLRRMLPKEHLWPIDEFWNFHCGGGSFKTVNIFTEALNKRFGKATSLEDYEKKAQVMAYDGERAMFEAYGRNKYKSTGVIQWMMNNAWPSMIWHLYDYYLRPGGGYFGAKKACEPLHIQYSYDDRSVVVANGFYDEFKGLKASAKIYNLDMTEKFSAQTNLDIAADGVKRIFTLPEAKDLSPVYFVKLKLEDAAGKLVSENFYWLSTQGDTMDKPRQGSDWYYTPTKQFADFTALNKLPPIKLSVLAKSGRSKGERITHVTVTNSTTSLAFFIHLKVKDKNGEEILPVIWEDNYFSLLPGEQREISATYADVSKNKDPSVQVEGWNVVP
ncbi:MAG TPA: glycoside hydrolase family 2 protein [Verrucomicrobiae bacterium]|jgi:exo-1,4-beta-D-glucosaminidase|nr:glycoside hydrolase family 2 protein [Verrucomicrobiae bacterium]